VEALLAEIEASGDAATRERTRALVAAILALHGDGLGALLAAVPVAV
jgi:hypothetical protein